MDRFRMFAISLTMLFVFMVGFSVSVEATTGFSVIPNFPPNQVEGISGVFDLRMTPGQQQQVSVTVSNNTDEPITVELSIFAAGTNRNGIIDYTAQGQLDDSAANSLSDIAHIPIDGDIAIPAGQSVEVPIVINVPEEGFEGVILGAIHTLLGITDEERASAGMIVNRFAQVVIVRLQQQEIIPEPDFALGEVSGDMVNHRAAIVANVINTQPRLSMGATVSAQIYMQGQDTQLFTITEIPVDFAPNAIFPLSMVDEQGFGIAPGDYTVNIQLAFEGQNWEFTRNLTIEPQAAQQMNDAAVNQGQQAPQQMAPDNNSFMILWIVLAISAVAIVALIVFAVLRSPGRNNRHK